MGERCKPSPQNAYAFSKIQLDHLAGYYRKQYPAWKLVGLRYFNVYGPREAHKRHMASMVYQLYLQMKAGKKPRIFKDGEQKRDFVYVKDVVEATLAASVASVPGVYNVGSGVSSSFNDVISRLNKALGLALDTEYFENPYSFYQNVTQADISKSREELCYEPRFDLEHGIDAYVKWLLKSGEP
jgi:ADP-L-glycero-D-manno-heptose 6-epimerase